MKQPVFLAFCLTLSLPLCGCQEAPQAVQDLQAIRSMFREFRTAVVQRSGNEAAQFVSAETVERYQQFRDWALSAEENALAERSLFEQVEILKLRQLSSRDQLESASGREVIALLIDAGQLSTPFIHDGTLADPVFQDGRCYVQVFDSSGPAKEKLTFFEEEQGWKIDLPSMEFVTESIYRRIMEVQNLSASQTVEAVLRSSFPDADLSALRQPLQQDRPATLTPQE